MPSFGHLPSTPLQACVTRFLNTSPSGRRKTISMSKEIFQQIKSLLAEPNPNKAAIARETGVSVVQVRKVADGGYDGKFGDSSVQARILPCQNQQLIQLKRKRIAQLFLPLVKNLLKKRNPHCLLPTRFRV